MKLVESRVSFIQEEHTYHLDGVILHGITGMLKRQLFPDEYKDVPEYILAKAAERGTIIHEVCEIADELGVIPSTVEGMNYVNLTKENGLVHECSEYLVSDNEYFASNIDKVYRDGDNSFILADIKTTSKLNKEYVRWQLSVYAYLFELQNPGAKVSRLFAIWLRGEHAELVEVSRIDTRAIQRLLECEKNGEQFICDVVPECDNTLPERYASISEKIIEIETQAKFWADKKKELLSGIKSEMDAAGVIKWEGESITFTRKKDTEREDFDKNAFKKAYPDLYSRFLKKTPVSGSVTLKIN